MYRGTLRSTKEGYLSWTGGLWIGNQWNQRKKYIVGQIRSIKEERVSRDKDDGIREEGKQHGGGRVFWIQSSDKKLGSVSQEEWKGGFMLGLACHGKEAVPSISDGEYQVAYAGEREGRVWVHYVEGGSRGKSLEKQQLGRHVLDKGKWGPSQGCGMA